MNIQVCVRNIYGNQRIYPVNEQALLLAELAGKKQLDQNDLALAKKLGFQVEIVADPKIALVA